MITNNSKLKEDICCHVSILNSQWFVIISTEVTILSRLCCVFNKLLHLHEQTQYSFDIYYVKQNKNIPVVDRFISNKSRGNVKIHPNHTISENDSKNSRNESKMSNDQYLSIVIQSQNKCKEQKFVLLHLSHNTKILVCIMLFVSRCKVT